MVRSDGAFSHIIIDTRLRPNAFDKWVGNEKIETMFAKTLYWGLFAFFHYYSYSPIVSMTDKTFRVYYIFTLYLLY